MREFLSRPRELSENVSLLGEILGQCIEKFEGSRALKLVEEIRVLSKKARAGDVVAKKKLHNRLRKISLDDKVIVLRAFNHFLNLTNVAEQQDKVRRKRNSEQQEGAVPQIFSLEDSFRRFEEVGISNKKIFDIFVDQEIELVFTAHPTEILRRSIIHKQVEIAKELSALDNARITKWEYVESIQALERHVCALWLTEDIRRYRPTPKDEARWGTALVEDVLWQTVPRHLKKLTRLLRDKTGQEFPIRKSPIRFSSWMGGDRDGNPFVIARETLAICCESRVKFIELLSKDVNKLYEYLTLTTASSNLCKKLPDSDMEFPYRGLLEQIHVKAQRTKDYWLNVQRTGKLNCVEDLYFSRDDILGDLYILFDSLKEANAENIARGGVLNLIRCVQVFGTNLLSLDIRQSADVHTRFFCEIMQDLHIGNYQTSDEYGRQKMLLKIINSNQHYDLNSFVLSEQSRELLSTLELIRDMPKDTFQVYIISMAEKCSHILEVYALQKLVNIKNTLQVVPLFETLESLETSSKVMKEVFSYKVLKKSFSKGQQIMIGYSDSSKRGGRLASAWSLYKAQVQLDELGGALKIPIRFFHGRGGTVGRGGGPTYLAIQAQPKGTVANYLRVTEQGEMLRAKFGLTGVALRTLEIYTGAVAHASISTTKKIPKLWLDLMERMSSVSEKSYRKFIYENPDFLPFYKEVTPESILNFLKMGSRPKKRKGADSVDSLRAIPWIFSWTQNRCILPSWLGVAEGLEEVKQEYGLNVLQSMYKEWGFFQATLDLIEMVLSKADMEIFKFYCNELLDPQTPDLSTDIYNRFQKTLHLLLEIKNTSTLLEMNNRLRKSISLRNPYADPINVVQASLLAQLRKDPKNETLIKAIVMSVNGVAAAMRNTG